MQKVRDDVEIYQLNTVEDNDVSSYFDSMFENGISSNKPDTKAYNNPDARVVDSYSLLKNNCVTTSLGGVNASGNVVDSDAISPIGLMKDLDRQAQGDFRIVKIENPKEFIDKATLKHYDYE